MDLTCTRHLYPVWEYLPEQYQPEFAHLMTMLGALESAVKDFGYACDLHEELCARYREEVDAMNRMQGGDLARIGSWIAMVAREAILTVREFDELLRSILTGALVRCRPIIKLMDRKGSTAAQSRFECTYPSIKALRDLMAHRAGQIKSPKALVKNSYFSSIHVRSGFDVATGEFRFFSDGQELTFRLHRDGQRELAGVVNDIVLAIEVAAARLVPVDRWRSLVEAREHALS